MYKVLISLMLAVAISLGATVAIAQTIIPGGDVFGTWGVAGSPYLIEGEITVPAGETLDIEPGVEVNFQGHYKLIVNGVLQALGTSDNWILFTAADINTGWHGIRFINAADTSRLEYCYLQYGKANSGGGDNFKGGGIFIDSSNLVISNCLIENCYAANYGGGIYACNCSLTLEYSIIKDNISENQGGGICVVDSNVPIHDNFFLNNISSYGSGGGGIYVTVYTAGVEVPIEDNIIMGNEASLGAAISFHGADSQISGNVIRYNYSDNEGGGLYMSYTNSPIFDNEITDNIAWYGGGIVCYYQASPTLYNNTISNNTGLSWGGGIVCYYTNCNPTLENCILWGNVPEQCYNSYVQMSYCDVQDGWSGTGNINADPLFVDAAQSDYRLQWGSPCIDTGNPNATYDPDGTVADMGCYYYDQSMPVRILLTPHNPPIIIPSVGGSFDYTIQATNIDPGAQQADIWCDVTLPNGAIYGPLLGPATVEISGGTTIDRLRTQNVPAGAPPGVYIYNAYAAVGADTSKDSFFFGKLWSYGQNRLADWSNFGEVLNEAEETPNLPPAIKLHSAYPDPFNPTTTISYELPAAAMVQLQVFDVAGRRIANLVNGWRSAGTHRVTFDGSGIASGIYVYRLRVGEYAESGKMMLLK